MVSEVPVVSFDFYGLKVELRSSNLETLRGIRRDFAYFEAAPSTPDAVIQVFDEKPDFGSLPDLPASIYSLNYICYRGKDAVYTDFDGRGLRISDSRQGSHRIFSESADLRHEITYLTILSAVGRFLDSRHLHRVHALGISKDGRAILVLLPEKGGKTTLALGLLRSGRFGLLSEDSPLITRKGEILPFPLRLGILPGGESDIPAEYRYTVNFMRVGPKVLVDVEYYRDKIGRVSQPGVVLLGRRCLGSGCRIVPVSRAAGAGEFVRNSVVGLGLHQGIEYLLGRNILETAGRTGLAFSRLYNSLNVVRRSRVYRYEIGHDRERNQQVLLDFLDGLRF